MDISQIKKLVKSNGDKFIILENGEPELVIMDFKEYEKLLGKRENTDFVPNIVTSEELITKRSPQIRESYRERQEFTPMAVSESIGLPVRLEDIRLEDLPI